MRVFVLAESYNAYLDWCSLRRVNPRAAECVTNPHVLRGQLSRQDQVIDARASKASVPNRQVAA